MNSAVLVFRITEGGRSFARLQYIQSYSIHLQIRRLSYLESTHGFIKYAIGSAGLKMLYTESTCGRKAEMPDKYLKASYVPKDSRIPQLGQAKVGEENQSLISLMLQVNKYLTASSAGEFMVRSRP